MSHFQIMNNFYAIVSTFQLTATSYFSSLKYSTNFLFLDTPLHVCFPLLARNKANFICK